MEEENKIIKDGIQGGLVESDISENVKSGFLEVESTEKVVQLSGIINFAS